MSGLARVMVCSYYQSEDNRDIKLWAPCTYYMHDFSLLKHHKWIHHGMHTFIGIFIKYPDKKQKQDKHIRK